MQQCNVGKRKKLFRIFCFLSERERNYYKEGGFNIEMDSAKGGSFI
jgi:hypothetical protein